MPLKDWGLLSLRDTLPQTVSLKTFVRKSVLFFPLLYKKAIKILLLEARENCQHGWALVPPYLWCWRIVGLVFKSKVTWHGFWLLPSPLWVLIKPSHLNQFMRNSWWDRHYRNTWSGDLENPFCPKNLWFHPGQKKCLQIRIVQNL